MSCCCCHEPGPSAAAALGQGLPPQLSTAVNLSLRSVGMTPSTLPAPNPPQAC